tara:strand:+ start:539 stop:697 length:159 start_codon:yes stop_codon:yes gene_type:complete
MSSRRFAPRGFFRIRNLPEAKPITARWGMRNCTVQANLTKSAAGRDCLIAAI